MCTSRTVALNGGLYSHGLRYSIYGDSYDHEGITITAGDYVMTDCLLPVNGVLVQIARLRPASVPATGPALSTIVQLRDPPQTTGDLGWGSFLYRVPDESA